MKTKIQKINECMFAEVNIPKNESHKRIMVDFDGTIHKYSKGFYDGSIYDEPFEGVKEALNQLKEKGYEIIIYSARICPDVNEDHEHQMEEMKEWLNRYEIPFDDMTYKKLAADLYIDDRGYRFEGDWNKEFPIMLEILERKGN